jgi:hypothetical protein
MVAAGCHGLACQAVLGVQPFPHDSSTQFTTLPSLLKVAEWKKSIAPGMFPVPPELNSIAALALAKADGDTDLRLALRDLGRTAQRGTAAVIITASDTADWLPDLLTLSQQGIESNVILLDRPSFGGEGNSEALRQAVRQLGFTCHVMRQGEMGQPIEETERRGFWEFRVTATGRAVPVKSPREETGGT